MKKKMGYKNKTRYRAKKYGKLDNKSDKQYDELILSASKYIFEVDKLKPVQKTIIKDIALFNRDVLAVLPTGYGKTLCYIVPGVLSNDKTLIISPLIQLMNNQAKLINKSMGDGKAVVTSLLRKKNLSEKIQNAKFIFTSPEKLESIQEELYGYRFRFIVIDEAHCVSLWSKDFRPAYSRISQIIEQLKTTAENELNIIALTATADKHIINDIKKAIPFNDSLNVYNKSCFRKNISIYTREVDGLINKLEYISYYMNRLERPGIIYCATKNQVEIVYEYIKSLDYPVLMYHSGLRKMSSEVLNRFLEEDNLITVTTNALGLGIDKRNIRFIIHFSLPLSPELYIQEVGRAGRDDLPASTILLYDKADTNIAEYLINKSKPSLKSYKKVYRGLNLVDGRTCKKISFISNVGMKDCREILETLKDAGIVKKVQGLYYRGKQLNYKNLGVSDKQRLKRTTRLRHMIDYAELSAQESNWEWLLKYMGYDLTTEQRKEQEDYSDDWINQDIELSFYRDYVDKFLSEYHPKIKRSKTHSDGFALSYYIETVDSKHKRSGIGNELYEVKYKKKEYISSKYLYQSAKVIKEHYPYDIDYLCICPSYLVHPFMLDFCNGLEGLLSESDYSIKFLNIIERLYSSRPQKNMKIFKRKASNIKNSFFIDEKHYPTLRNKNILLVDDIYDSGETMKECARVLGDMHVKNVYVFTLVKTIRTFV